MGKTVSFHEPTRGVISGPRALTSEQTPAPLVHPAPVEQSSAGAAPGPATSGRSPDGAPTPDLPTVLLVDDEPAIVRGYARILRSVGFAVEVAHDGHEAAGRVQKGGLDVIVSDIAMPGMNGIDLLRKVREHDLDIPVVLMTGGPAIESAVEALEYGALRYLVKPIDPKQLQDVVARAVRLHQIAKVRRRALDILNSEARQLGDRAGLESRFKRALETIWIAYQPIVSWSCRTVFAYEALVRNEEQTLRNPSDFFETAERLGRVEELGRAIRRRIAENLSSVPEDLQLFVNLHTFDLSDEELFSPQSPLSRFAQRITLEITERAALEGVKDVPLRVQRLRSMGYRIAMDDLGAGYAGLTSFAQLEPDVVKLDMSLIRGVDRSPTKQKLLHSMITLCQDLGMKIVSEGVETPAERDALLAMGGDLFQGYLFARPAWPFPVVSF